MLAAVVAVDELAPAAVACVAHVEGLRLLVGQSFERPVPAAWRLVACAAHVHVSSGFIGFGRIRVDSLHEFADGGEVLMREDSGLVFASLVVEAQIGAPARDERAFLESVLVVHAVDFDFESDGEHVLALLHGEPARAVRVVGCVEVVCAVRAVSVFVVVGVVETSSAQVAVAPVADAYAFWA